MNHRLHALLPNLEGPRNTWEALFFARGQVMLMMVMPRSPAQPLEIPPQVLHLRPAVMAPCGAWGIFTRDPATMRRWPWNSE